MGGMSIVWGGDIMGEYKWGNTSVRECGVKSKAKTRDHENL